MKYKDRMLPFVLCFFMFCGCDTPPQPVDDDDVYIFVDEPASPVGGFREIQKALNYPPIARKAGIEGRVIIKVLISKHGQILDTLILQSIGHAPSDQAAVEAAMQVKWKSALYQGKTVKAWVVFPVLFKLK